VIRDGHDGVDVLTRFHHRPRPVTDGVGYLCLWKAVPDHGKQGCRKEHVANTTWLEQQDARRVEVRLTPWRWPKSLQQDSE
jgi:hypothetical protein